MNKLKSYCMVLTANISCAMSMSDVCINTAPVMYDDDEDISKQIRLLYARFNRLLSLFNHCDTYVKMELCRILFYVNLYSSFLWTYIYEWWLMIMYLFEVVLVLCMLQITYGFYNIFQKQYHIKFLCMYML